MSDKPFTVELWDIAKVIPYPRNAKKHSPEQIEKLATAIKTFGWTQPIIVDKDGIVIAGHGRRLAAIHLGRDKVPVVCRKDLSKDEADALRLSDNRVTSIEYDMLEIEKELKRLNDSDFDLSLIGYDAQEIDFSIGDLGEMDEGSFVENIGDAVALQQEQNEKSSETTDDIAAPVADALGFKRVTIAQSRELRTLMTKIETSTGKTGVEALIAVLSSAT